jgi:hypothetical protein
MPTHKIEVSEYECAHCGYRWINRVNGNDGPMPQRCAKCKRTNWNTGFNETVMTPRESGLRRRIKNLYKIYHDAVWRLTSPLPDHKTFSVDDYLNPKVVAKFLTLDNPRPTISELRGVLYPSGLELELDSQNFYRREAYIPDPEKPGWLKHDKPPYKNYLRMVKSDAQKQEKAMQQIIKSRKKREREQEQKEEVVANPPSST